MVQNVMQICWNDYVWVKTKKSKSNIGDRWNRLANMSSLFFA